MISYIFAFLFGIFVPAIASRYPKSYASDWGEWLFFLWHKPHFPHSDKIERVRLLKKKWQKMLFFSLFWGVCLTALFVTVDLFAPQNARCWAKVFMCLMALLSAVDQQYFLLPDILTVPLIFLGFGYALWADVIPPAQSFFGACYGFFMPAAAVLVSSKFLKNAFGGGDVKMLAGLGAWVGMLPLCVVLMISIISFVFCAALTGRRAGAYGPHLALGGIIVLFLTANHLIAFL